RISLSEDSLTLRGVDYGDQGGFVCRATTPLDSAEAEAWLRVVGRPGPVRDLQLLELGEREIRLSWTPGDDHNSPIERGQPWAPLQLPPHGRFRFRVLATNAYGRGEPSAPSDAITT
ncbi:NGCA protein, partial [Upupa epops]|nr:NGCA protein [Upupa epops]